MPDAVNVEAVRTAPGQRFDSLSRRRPAELAAVLRKAWLEHTGGRYGLQTVVCNGGGKASATVIARLP